MFRQVLFLLGLTVLLSSFIGKDIGRPIMVADAIFPPPKMGSFRSGSWYISPNQVASHFGNPLGPIQRASPHGPRRSTYGNWQKTNTQRQITGQSELNGVFTCDKQAKAIITILAYNQDHIFLTWVENCKEYSDKDGKIMDMGCSATHRSVGLDADDDIAVMLPDTVEKVITTMKEKYGRDCFEVYYRYVEIEWHNAQNPVDGSFNPPLTKMRPVVRLI